MTFCYTGYNFKNTVCFCIRELCTWFTFTISNRKCLLYWNTIHLVKDDIRCLTEARRDRCSLSLLLVLFLLVAYKDTGFMMINVHCHWECMSLWEYVLHLFTYCWFLSTLLISFLTHSSFGLAHTGFCLLFIVNLNIHMDVIISRCQVVDTYADRSLPQ